MATKKKKTSEAVLKKRRANAKLRANALRHSEAVGSQSTVSSRRNSAVLTAAAAAKKRYGDGT